MPTPPVEIVFDSGLWTPIDSDPVAETIEVLKEYDVKTLDTARIYVCRALASNPANHHRTDRKS